MIAIETQPEKNRFLTAQETAQKWGVSSQTVTIYAAAGRIPGAQKQNGKWSIPADAERPIDRRRRTNKASHNAQWWSHSAETSSCTYGPHVLSTIWFPPGAADQTIETIPDPILREQLLAELCYLRCEFDKAKQHLKTVQESKRGEFLVPCWFHTVENALHMADWETMLHGLATLDDLAKEQRRKGNITIAKAAELAIDTFWIVANSPERCQQWIKQGDFSQLPAHCLVDATYAYCKYLQNSDQTGEMLSAFRMASALIGDNPFWRGYPSIMALMAYSYTSQTEIAGALARQICTVLAADRFLVPIADSMTHIVQFLSQHADLDQLGGSNQVQQWGKSCSANWLRAIELTTQENKFAYSLSLKEIETMWLASAGMTNKEIAQHLDLSINTVKLRLQTIYEKLHIKRRKELKKYIYFG